MAEMTKIERAVGILEKTDPELAAYVRETYDALNDVTNEFMPQPGSGCDSRSVPDSLVRASAVLCDIQPEPVSAPIFG